MKLLFVCTGNICRSPMAEALFRRALQDRASDLVEVKSAGTWATDGSPATSQAQSVMRRRDIDLSAHRSRALDEAMLERADLVIAMTSVHALELFEVAPHAAAKVRLLKELPELAAHVGDDVDARARLAGLLAAPRPASRRALDVDDPIGLPKSAYERCARELEAAIDALVAALLGPPEARPKNRT